MSLRHRGPPYVFLRRADVHASRTATQLHSEGYEETREFRKRYAERAGIKATNSELKRAHGLGHLRVRGILRVKLRVYLKALSCNVKRVARHLSARARRSPVHPPGTEKGVSTRGSFLPSISFLP